MTSKLTIAFVKPAKRLYSFPLEDQYTKLSDQELLELALVMFAE